MNNNVQKAIDSIRKKVEAVPQMVEESCQTIATQAQGRARGGIIVTAGPNYVTASGGNAAYYEFGTGDDAQRYIQSTLPTEWDEYAFSFYKTGEGTIKHRPFLFPAYEAERIELIKKIKESFERR